MTTQVQIDVLVITGLLDELNALLDLYRDKIWHQERDSQGFPYHVRPFVAEDGSPLTIAAAWSGQMGELAAGERSRALIDHLRPSCLAMCGICAGRRDTVFLGDVIVASTTFSYDSGKMVANNEGPQEYEEFLHEITTYNLKKTWHYDAEYFKSRMELPKEELELRPKSLEFQRRWVLRWLRKRNGAEGSTPTAELRAEFVPRWDEAIRSLVKKKLVKIDDGNLVLTKSGMKTAERDILLYPDKTPSDPPFRVHVGPIVTGKAVRSDPNVWKQVRKLNRSVLGLEMEANAIGFVAELDNIPSIIVKSVTDYADPDKDDSFRTFAARSSAFFLVEFLKRTPPSRYIAEHLWPRPLKISLDQITQRNAESLNQLMQQNSKILFSLAEINSLLRNDDVQTLSLGLAKTETGRLRIEARLYERTGEAQALKELNDRETQLLRELADKTGGTIEVRHVVSDPSFDPEPRAKLPERGKTSAVVLGSTIRTLNSTRATVGFFVRTGLGEPGFICAGHNFDFERLTEEALIVSSLFQTRSPKQAEEEFIPIGILQRPMDQRQFEELGSDAALVRLLYNIPFHGNVVPFGYDLPFEGKYIHPPEEKMEFLLSPETRVYKFGSSSGLTAGHITAFGIANVRLGMPSGRWATFDDMIEVESLDYDTTFALPGDSGALVFAQTWDKLIGVGMVTGAGTVQDQSGRKKRFAYVSPISKIFAGLKDVSWLTWLPT
jgi:nucleoside phosphorylase